MCDEGKKTRVVVQNYETLGHVRALVPCCFTGLFHRCMITPPIKYTYQNFSSEQ